MFSRSNSIACQDHVGSVKIRSRPTDPAVWALSTSAALISSSSTGRSRHLELGRVGSTFYAGTIRSAEFDRIVTHADGAVGVQVSQPVGRLSFRRGIETHGAIGQSLVKGCVAESSSNRAQHQTGRICARDSGISRTSLPRKGCAPLGATWRGRNSLHRRGVLLSKRKLGFVVSESQCSHYSVDRTQRLEF